MSLQRRKVTYKLYPTPKQAAVLARIVHAWLHSQLQAQNKGQELSLGCASRALETATIAPLAFGGR